MKEIVASGLEVPEGPVVLPDGRIAFVEQRRGQVSVFDGDSVSCLATVGGAANAVTLGADALYAAQNGGVVNAWRSADPRTPGIQRVYLDGRVEYVTTEVDGQPLLAPNDLCFGPDGRLWFTDPGHPYDPDRRGANGRLVAIGQGRDEIVADVGPVYCNGLAFGVDGRLVWVESYARHVSAASARPGARSSASFRSTTCPTVWRSRPTGGCSSPRSARPGSPWSRPTARCWT